MKIHDSYGKQNFDDKACFLCGKSMDGDPSLEHVFPKWLLRNYGLWDQKIDLLNGSSIPYRQLTIPCCEECNNQHLSRVEKDVQEAVSKGFIGARNLPKKTWYLWAGKVFYGMLRKELTLLLERSSPNGGTIVSKDILESFSNLHLFLQAFRGKHQFSGEKPYSVLICNLHEFGNNYDFRDSLFLFTLAMRMGEIGIIISFEDGGLIRETYGRYVDDVGGRKLHPIQFYELYAKVSYQVKLRQQPLTFQTQYHVEGKYTASTDVVHSSTPMDKWDQEEFIHLLRRQVSPWISETSKIEFSPPDRVSSWMVDGSGEILLLSKDDWEAPKKS